MRLRRLRPSDWLGVAVLTAVLWLSCRGFVDVLEDLL